MPVESWSRLPNDDALAVHFTTGSPECYGVHATVRETTETVTVELRSGSLPEAVGRMCIMIAVFGHARGAAAGAARRPRSLERDLRTEPRQTSVERVLVLGVTSKVFTRDELAAAFANFEATVARAAETRDWDPWVEQYTPDVTYIEHAAGTWTRPRRGAGLDLEDHEQLPGQPHDGVSVAVVGHRRAERPDHLRAGQPDGRPRRRHHHQRHEHLDHHLRRRRPVVPPGGHLQPAALRVGDDEVVPQGPGARHAARRGGELDAAVRAAGECGTQVWSSAPTASSARTSPGNWSPTATTSG